MSDSGLKLTVTGVFPAEADETFPDALNKWAEEQLQAVCGLAGREVAPGTIRRVTSPAPLESDPDPSHRAITWTADTRPAT